MACLLSIRKTVNIIMGYKIEGGFYKFKVVKKYFKLGIILSVLSLTACQFSPTSTTVTITNDTNEEFVYWLSYRLGEMQNIDDRAPTLAPGESRTWIIKGTLSGLPLYINIITTIAFVLATRATIFSGYEYLNDKKTLGTVRVGLSQFNTKEDIDALADALMEVDD